jgi:hypothetical protein
MAVAMLQLSCQSSASDMHAQLPLKVTLGNCSAVNAAMLALPRAILLTYA